jgi:protocatechuate 3,4-dioxygenase beta subunit
LDSDCNPLPGATLEIWHCNTLGVYSGDIDGGNDAMCTGGDADAAAALWYRGVQSAGADGRVTFDTNFPGWYASRATHIHFKASVGSIQTLTSQVFFDDAFKREVYDSQPNYQPTSKQGYQANSGDKVLTEAKMTIAEVTMSVEKQSDGALLAWKAIVVST